MQKHISNQHENGEKCDKGVTNSETLKTLEEHMTDQEKNPGVDQDEICPKCTMENFCICEWVEKANEAGL